MNKINYLYTAMNNHKKIFTLTQLNQSLENHFWENFSMRTFWITAELVKINQKNGHFYIELADSVKEQVTAGSTATIWSSVFNKIVGQIGLSEITNILQPGNKVLINVKIEYHKIYGLKLKIRDIDPSYSYGEIERKRQEVIERLKNEGIFELQKKLRLPAIIKKIALISSPGTSGYRDFYNELFNNHEFRKFKILDFPVRVQGEFAAKEIIRAVKTANLYDVDVIVIIRGGGSKMDLALFDDYGIAKAICHSHLPVITGIGHETDLVIADLVARQHFITPTAVALHIHYAISSFKEIIKELYIKTARLSQEILSKSKEEFIHCSNYLSHYSRELIHFWHIVFQEMDFKILQNSRILLFAEKDELLQYSHNISSKLQHLVNLQRNNLSQKLEAVHTLTKQKTYNENQYNLKQILQKIQILSLQTIDEEQIKLENRANLLEILNPLSILSNGYTISTIDNIDVRYAIINVGDEMKTLTNKHLITSKIINKQNI